jgi:hypothetical protein
MPQRQSYAVAQSPMHTNSNMLARMYDQGVKGIIINHCPSSTAAPGYGKRHPHLHHSKPMCTYSDFKAVMLLHSFGSVPLNLLACSSLQGTHTRGTKFTGRVCVMLTQGTRCGKMLRNIPWPHKRYVCDYSSTALINCVHVAVQPTHDGVNPTCATSHHTMARM